MRRFAAIAALIVLVAGCSGSRRDLEGVEHQRPDSIELFDNVEGHPNIVHICVDGIGFATTTREYGDAIQRIPEWDADCATQRR